MVFQYKRVLISGTQEGVEGVSAALAEMSTFMQDAGWTLVDDRSAEPATAVDSTHMKYVFSSNGEEGNYPTFFVTMYSGINATSDSSIISFDVHTAYDVGSHTIPSSGVRSTLTATSIGQGATSLNVRSQDDNTEVYMSGDSEMVHFITRREGTNASSLTMDNTMVGRFNSFMTLDENPYPLCSVGVNGTSITTTSTSVLGIGGNPPQSFSASNEMEAIVTTLNDNATFYDIGSATDIWFAEPILINYRDASPIDRQGIAGTVRNGWRGGSPNAGLLNLSILTASGTSGVQTYQSFSHATSLTLRSIIVRKS